MTQSQCELAWQTGPQPTTQTLRDITIVEKRDGDVVWRLMCYTDEDAVPCSELYKAEMEYYDDGDPENGPHLGYDLSMWQQVRGWIGCPMDMEEAIARYKAEMDMEEAIARYGDSQSR